MPCIKDNTHFAQWQLLVGKTKTCGHASSHRTLYNKPVNFPSISSHNHWAHLSAENKIMIWDSCDPQTHLTLFQSFETKECLLTFQMCRNAAENVNVTVAHWSQLRHSKKHVDILKKKTRLKFSLLDVRLDKCSLWICGHLNRCHCLPPPGTRSHLMAPIHIQVDNKNPTFWIILHTKLAVHCFGVFR